jgi:hypothetical protein
VRPCRFPRRSAGSDRDRGVPRPHRSRPRKNSSPRSPAGDLTPESRCMRASTYGSDGTDDREGSRALTLLTHCAAFAGVGPGLPFPSTNGRSTVRQAQCGVRTPPGAAARRRRQMLAGQTRQRPATSSARAAGRLPHAGRFLLSSRSFVRFGLRTMHVCGGRAGMHV